MFLALRKIRGHRYLYLLETIPAKKKGSYTNRIVKNLGNFDKLPEEFEMPSLIKRQNASWLKASNFSCGKKISTLR